MDSGMEEVLVGPVGLEGVGGGFAYLQNPEGTALLLEESQQSDGAPQPDQTPARTRTHTHTHTHTHTVRSGSTNRFYKIWFYQQVLSLGTCYRF